MFAAMTMLYTLRRRARAHDETNLCTTFFYEQRGRVILKVRHAMPTRFIDDDDPEAEKQNNDYREHQPEACHDAGRRA